MIKFTFSLGVTVGRTQSGPKNGPGNLARNDLQEMILPLIEAAVVVATAR